MIAARKPRSLWPLVLFAALLVLLAGAAIATAQLYWSSLRAGVEQMRASLAAAQEQQLQLLERLRVAEASLAQRAGARPTAGACVSAPARGAAATPVAPQPVSSLRLSLPPDERGRLLAWLKELGLAAARLPATRGPGALPARPARQLLRRQLAIAAGAAAAGDVRLLDAALVAAERLTGAPHRASDEPGAALAQRLAELRARLQTPASAARHGVVGQAPPGR